MAQFEIDNFVKEDGHVAEVALETSAERITAGGDAGQEYVDELEKIRDDLDAAENTGTTLGTMVAAQLAMTEAETKYMVKTGIPKKASGAVQQAAMDIKKAAG